MSLSITKNFSTKAPKPLLNAQYTISNRNRFSSISLTNAVRQKKQLFDWFKTRPELNSPVSVRVNDTIVGVDFFKPGGAPLGSTNLKKAQKFWTENFMDERMKSIWFDAITTGEGFGWKGTLTKSQLKDLSESYGKALEGMKSVDVKELQSELYEKLIDEDTRNTRVFDYVASSTMEIAHDNREVKGYVQRVNAEEEEFTKEEIIHFTFNRLDGRVEGYTPVSSLAPELILIWFIKENMLAYMKNNGVPKKIFSLSEELANSDNHQYLIQQLETFGAVQNRHGNLVLTGKIDIQDLEEKLKDMEYKELALYVAGNIAYALQIPVSRIPYMIGKAQSSGDAGGLAESGYWSMIESDQKKIENLLNTQMFQDMGFEIRFKKTHRIDDLREVQAWSMKADAVTKVDGILAKFGKKLTDIKLLSLMDLGEGDLEERPEEMMEVDKTGLMNQNLLNNQELSQGDKSVKRDKARTAAVNNPKGMPQDGN